MNFADFQQLRATVIREQPSVIDCAETNLYSTLKGLIPPIGHAPDKTVHRCHLASEWADRFDLPAEVARRALISCGVRDSLGLLFGYYAGTGARVWLPSDNYPVYGELAKAAGLECHKFPTLPEPIWPGAVAATGDEILVVTNPLKPLGRWLTATDVFTLKEWLNSSPRRRVILDVVYTFETRFHATTLDLLATGQVLLLHSLTKGWLHPRLFGVALVPDSDAPTLTPVFRAHPPSQHNLARARELIASHSCMPGDILSALSTARTDLLRALPGKVKPPPMESAPGYFTPVAAPWRRLLKDHNILGLPATVFGSRNEDITILSSLGFTASNT